MCKTGLIHFVDWISYQRPLMAKFVGAFRAMPVAEAIDCSLRSGKMKVPAVVTEMPK